jgi:hypothetical protein
VEKYYRNIGLYFLILILFIGLGFYYPYFSLFPGFKSVTTTVHVHTLTLMSWTLILIAQPILIRYKKYKAHKIIGRVTYVLVPLVIITCIGVMRQQYNEDLAQKMTQHESLKSLFTSLTGILSIIIYYLLAIIAVLKGNIAFHMRYMICLFLEFIPPTFGRTLGYWLNMRQVYTHTIAVAVGALILVILILADKKRKLNFTPYVVALALYLIFTFSWFAIGHPL